MNTPDGLYPMKQSIIGYPSIIDRIDKDGKVWGRPDFNKLNGPELIRALYDTSDHIRLDTLLENNLLRCLGISTDK